MGRKSPNRKPRTTLPAYFKGISERIQLQARQMTPVIVHSGEMGDNDHAWFAEILRQQLPHRIGVDSGFVVNHKSDKGSAEFFATTKQSRAQDPHISPQMDILLLDVLYNAPFCCEKTFKVCPVEMVLGAVEVTRTLNASKLREDIKKLAAVKGMARDRRYRQPPYPGSDAKAMQLHPIYGQPLPYGYVVGLQGSLPRKTIEELILEFPENLRPDGVLILDRVFF